MTAIKEITAKIIELLQPLNSENIAIEPETEISVDLNVDSMAVMDFVMEVEDHFDIDIPLNVLSETHTVADLAKVVAERTAKG